LNDLIGLCCLCQCIATVGGDIPDLVDVMVVEADVLEEQLKK
jgi:hypothetical protein